MFFVSEEINSAEMAPKLLQARCGLIVDVHEHLIIDFDFDLRRKVILLLYLRNRKHVPCSCSIELYKHEWKFGRTRNAVGTRAAGECFHSFFEFSQTFTSVCITR